MIHRRKPLSRGKPPKRSGKPLRRRSRPKARYRTKGGRHSDPAKLAWLHSLPCALSYTDGAHCEGPVEAHHERRLGERATDRKAFPLCATGHHRDGQRSRHVLGKRFAAVHKHSGDDLAATYEQAWQFHLTGGLERV